MQLCFLDRQPPRPDPEFRGARRFDLERGAWVESVPGWLGGHAQVFEQLLASADWERHRRRMYERILEVPRLVATMPGSGRRLAWNDEETVEVAQHRSSPDEVQESVRLLRSLAELLSARYGRVLGHVSLAYYRDGRDSVAFHGDKLGPLRADTVVCVVSVGERRRFLLRPALEPGERARGGGDPRESLVFTVGEGDLLVMGGTCQQTWEHAVPKAAHAGPRIAIMFRESLPSVHATRHDAAAGSPLDAVAGSRESTHATALPPGAARRRLP